MRPADRACLAIAAGVTAYEVAALARPDWELITHAVARYRRHHPAWTQAVILSLALHLLGWIPKRLDPLHLLVGVDCGMR